MHLVDDAARQAHGPDGLQERQRPPRVAVRRVGHPQDLVLVEAQPPVEAPLAGERVADQLDDVLDLEISPELLPPDADGGIAQKTEDIVGPYELTDFFGYWMLRWGRRPSSILRLAIEAFDGKY